MGGIVHMCQHLAAASWRPLSRKGEARFRSFVRPCSIAMPGISPVPPAGPSLPSGRARRTLRKPPVNRCRQFAGLLHGRQFIEDRIVFACSPATFGGTRVYFLCPGCECRRRVSRLYFAHGIFRCSNCHGLAYGCRAEDREQRARRRADKRRARLGLPEWRPGALPPVTRPKGMWRTTFVRLQDTAVAADIVADMHWESNLMKIARRVNRPLRPQL